MKHTDVDSVSDELRAKAGELIAMANRLDGYDNNIYGLRVIEGGRNGSTIRHIPRE